MSRTHKKEYSGSKSVDTRCRSHGSCSQCASNRQHKNSAAEVAYQEYLAEAYCQCNTHCGCT